MNQSPLPLELLFKRRANERPTELPQMSADLFAQYQQLLNVLRTEYYPKIDAGLAANSSKPGLYTAHDAEHFDEVVFHAGELLSAESSLKNEMTPAISELNAYELYILLVAIRIHDVGNIFGRDNHEKKCFQILRDLGGAAGLDNREKKAIADIAQAHGGKTQTFSKDTIGQLAIKMAAGNVSFRPRLIAGIVRIADEICENKRRAANALERHSCLPKHNEIYHKYAASVHENRWSPSDRTIYLSYEANLSVVGQPWGCEQRISAGAQAVTETYLLDEVFARLEKMDLERRYCNMFTRELFTIDAIKASITIVTDEHFDVIERITVPELSDRGYPENRGEGLRNEMKDYCGASYGEKLRNTERV